MKRGGGIQTYHPTGTVSECEALALVVLGSCLAGKYVTRFGNAGLAVALDSLQAGRLDASDVVHTMHPRTTEAEGCNEGEAGVDGHGRSSLVDSLIIATLISSATPQARAL